MHVHLYILHLCMIMGHAWPFVLHVYMIMGRAWPFVLHVYMIMDHAWPFVLHLYLIMGHASLSGCHEKFARKMAAQYILVRVHSALIDLFKQRTLGVFYLPTPNRM